MEEQGMIRPTGLNALRSLDYTMLICRDVATMRTFYVDALGLRVERELPGRYVELRVGAVVLALRRRGRPYDGPAPPPGSAGVQLAFRVAPGDVDVIAGQLADLGIETLEPVTTLSEFGHRALFVADPEHNVVEFYAEI